MNDRVHACLDGELDRDALTPAERAELAALETALEDASAVLRAAPTPDLTARVMGALPVLEPAPAMGGGAWDRALAWLWRPREVSVHFRPAYALAGAALVALVAVVAPLTVPAPGAPMAAVAPEGVPTARLYVQFRLEAPEAASVQLAGSFTGWQPELELRETAPGVWSALVPLDPGVHDYTFVVDGERWVVDPYAPHVEDSFGGTNSRLFLPTPLAESA